MTGLHYEILQTGRPAEHVARSTGFAGDAHKDIPAWASKVHLAHRRAHREALLPLRGLFLRCHAGQHVVYLLHHQGEMMTTKAASSTNTIHARILTIASSIPFVGRAE